MATYIVKFDKDDPEVADYLKNNPYFFQISPSYWSTTLSKKELKDIKDIISIIELPNN